MKRNTLLPLLLLLLGGSNQLMAQRHADLSFTIVSPADGTVIDNGDSRTVQMQLTNNGPDTFLVTDTLYISGTQLEDVLRGHPSQNLAPGVSAGVQLSAPFGTLLNDRTGVTDTTITICYSMRTGNQLPEPVVSGVWDTLPADNESCITVTLKGALTGIAGRSNDALQPLVVYPNPAREKVMFRLPLQQGTPVKAWLRDGTGRLLRARDYGLQKAGTVVLELETAGLAPGMYLLEVVADGQHRMGKLLLR